MPGVHNSGWVQSPGAERLGDPGYTRVLHDYVTGVMTQFRTDDRVLGWDLWNEPDNPATRVPKGRAARQATSSPALLPQVFRWARAVDPIQPLTSGVWQGDWAEPGRPQRHRGIQLDNSDVITFHSYAEPVGLRGPDHRTRATGAPDPMHRVHGPAQGSTIETILPSPSATTSAPSTGVWSRERPRPTAVGLLGPPVPGAPEGVVHDLLLPDGRPYRDSEFQATRTLTGGPQT